MIKNIGGVSMSSSNTVKVASVNLEKDENEVLEIYRKAKLMGYADITITVQEGSRVKLWLTEKMK